MIVIVPILIFFSVVILFLAFGSPQSEAMESRLQKYGYGADLHRAGDLSSPFSQRIIVPIFSNLAELANSLAPEQLKQKVEARLMLAGKPYGLDATQFLAAATAAGLILTLPYMTLVRIVGRPLEFKDVLMALALCGIGFYLLPNLWLGIKVSARQKQIERSLPDALDLITVCVEAGLTLEAALARVVSRTEGPLAKEFDRALQEINVGKARGKALKDISKRTGVAELQSIIAALVQSEEMGSSIAKVLRIQSESVRVKRQQRAQEKAHEAPVKMMFPLVLFILPAMFVVILGPAAIRLINIFTGMR